MVFGGSAAVFERAFLAVVRDDGARFFVGTLAGFFLHVAIGGRFHPGGSASARPRPWRRQYLAPHVFLVVEDGAASLEIDHAGASQVELPKRSRINTMAAAMISSSAPALVHSS